MHNIELLNYEAISQLLQRVEARQIATEFLICSQCKPNCVIHLAALKSLVESIEKPLQYYENNLFSSILLIKVVSSEDEEREGFYTGLPRRRYQ